MNPRAIAVLAFLSTAAVSLALLGLNIPVYIVLALFAVYLVLP